MRIDLYQVLAILSVDADEDTAINGEWAKGPGRALFDDLEAALGPLPLIAEDLGSVDEGTIALRDGLGLPGMRVLQFGLDGNPENIHHPDNYPAVSVAYSSTHDSESCAGGAQGGDEQHRLALGHDAGQAARTMVDAAVGCMLGDVPLQDVLGLGNDADERSKCGG